MGGSANRFVEKSHDGSSACVVEELFRRFPQRPAGTAAGCQILRFGRDGGKIHAWRFGKVSQLVEQQPESPERAEATAQVMSKWTNHNPEGASAWMKRQPVGQVRDAAISSFVQWANFHDPEAALLWAGTISDSAKRMNAVTHTINTLQQLRGEASASVRPWLESNTTLTESEREEILQKLDRPR